MNRGFKILALMLCVVAISGCKSKKKAATTQVNAVTQAKYWENQMAFENIEARGKATITMNEKTNNVSMHLKMKKDSVIWGKFSLFGFGATVLITADSFFMVDNINQQYMAYDNDFLNQYLGFKAEVGQVQDLLLGNAIFSQDKYKTNAEGTQLIGSDGIAQNTVTLNAIFRTMLSEFDTPDTTQHASVGYEMYHDFEQQQMPKVVTIDLEKGEQTVDVVLNYQNIYANDKLSFPFKIPYGFQRR
ncbi:MAG: DUF4292 domain-containing protein [Bacteroidetes bacterium]|jgi:hypothetical protein|nr:DUF4292 domain-containing protein [Bacteroidota bacterium]